jgi:hypothetical protein
MKIIRMFFEVVITSFLLISCYIFFFFKGYFVSVCVCEPALFERAHGCLDLREDLRGPVLGPSLGGLTRNPSGSAPSHGEGAAGGTATFLNVVLLLALPERDLREDLRGPVLSSSLGGLTRNPSGSAPRHGDGTAGGTGTFLNVVLLLAPFELAHGCLDLREDLRGSVLGSSLGGLTRIPSGSAP